MYPLKKELPIFFSDIISLYKSTVYFYCYCLQLFFSLNILHALRSCKGDHTNKLYTITLCVVFRSLNLECKRVKETTPNQKEENSQMSPMGLQHSRKIPNLEVSCSRFPKTKLSLPKPQERRTTVKRKENTKHYVILYF